MRKYQTYFKSSSCLDTDSREKIKKGNRIMKKRTKFFKRLASLSFAAIMAASLLQSPVYASSEVDFFGEGQKNGETETEVSVMEIPSSEDISEGNENTVSSESKGKKLITGDEPSVYSTDAATFLSGTAFAVKIKELSGDSNAGPMSRNTSITAIRREAVSEKPSSVKDVVSTSTSEAPIYAWYDNGILYFASDADKLYLNKTSNFMFCGLEGLTDIDVLSEIDSSNAESMIEMFAGCNSLQSINLSSFVTAAVKNMDKMFSGDEALSEITLGDGWEFTSATSLPKENWVSSIDGSVWTYAALETEYSSKDAATFSVTSDAATVTPKEELFEGDGLNENNMYPVGQRDRLDARFTGYCINDQNQEPYGYYRRVEITPEETIGKEWFQSSDFGSEPIGDTMREALITMAIEGEKALAENKKSFMDIQKDVWHFTSHYSDNDWDGSFWENKNFHKIDQHQITKLFLYKSLEGRQNVVSAEGIEIVQPVKIKIVKVDDMGNAVSGAILTLTGNFLTDTEGEETAAITPIMLKSEELENGQVELYPGNYRLSETKTPVGYGKADDILFTVEADGTVTCDNLVNGAITMIDEKKTEPPVESDVSISKQDIAGKEIAGARLTVKDSSNKVIASWVSVEGKTHVIRNLPEGDYTLTESVAPSGYEKAESIDFSVNEKGSVTVNGKKADVVVMIDDYKRGSITISKQDIAGKEIEGAVLTVTDAKGKVVDSWTSSETSHVIRDVPAGNYTLSEKQAPDGYVKAENIDFSLDNEGIVWIDGTKTDKIIMTDDYAGCSVTISKQDIAGKELAGAKLKVTDEDGKTVDEWISTNRTHEIKDVKPGDYTLVEITAPEGYETAESIAFTVNIDGTVTVDKKDIDCIVMVDRYEKNTVSIRKVEVTKSVESMLPGAKLSVLDKEEKAVVSWTSGETAKLLTLEPGSYTLVEVEAPEGYEISDPIAFTVNEDGSVTLGKEKKPLDKPIITMIDEVSSSTKKVKILKVGMDNKALSGAELKVTHKDNGRESIDSQWTSSEREKELELIPGKYTLHETSAPDGYVTADDIEFTVKADGTVTVDGATVKTITMKDKPTSVDFKKKDSETDDWVSGAKLQVLDKKGSVIEEWTTDKNVHTVSGKLKAGGEYILHEDSAPDGYDKADDIKFTVNKDSSVLTVTMKDTPKEPVIVEYGTLQIFKTVNGDGADLNKKFGFIISIMNSDNSPFTGKLPYTMSTGDAGSLAFNSNGRAGFELSNGQYILFDKVPAGTYYTVSELDYSAEGYTASVRDGAAETKKGENIISYVNTHVTAVSSTGITSTGQRTVSGTITSRDTGDSSNILLWCIIFGGAIVLICVWLLIRYFKKRRK